LIELITLQPNKGRGAWSAITEPLARYSRLFRGFYMIKIRKIDRLTHHIKARIVVNCEGDFSSATETFLRALEDKILMSSKGFKHSGITLEFMGITIK